MNLLSPQRREGPNNGEFCYKHAVECQSTSPIIPVDPTDPTEPNTSTYSLSTGTPSTTDSVIISPDTAVIPSSSTDPIDPSTATDTPPEPLSSQSGPSTEGGQPTSSAPLTVPTIPTVSFTAPFPSSSGTDTLSIAPSGSSSSPQPSSTTFAASPVGASSKAVNTGAIAGGVIGGIGLLLLILALVLFRKPLSKRLRRFRNKGVAPSAEFLNPSSQLFTSQSRLGGLSPSPNPYHAHQRGLSAYSVRDVYGTSDGPPVDEEQPPPFTRGSFTDPVFEKVESAARQREMFLQVHGGPSSSSHHDHDGASELSYNPYDTPNPFGSYAHYPIDHSDFPATSPILTSDDHNPAGSSSAQARVKSPRSTEGGWAV